LASMTTSGLGTQTLDFGAVTGVSSVTIDFPANGFFNFDNVETGDTGNMPPTAANIPGDVTVTEDMASDFDLSAVVFADAEGDPLTVTLAATAGTFAAASSGGVAVGGSGTGTLTLTGSAANINTYLDTVSNIQYTGAANAAGNDAAIVTVNANDGTSNPQVGTINVDIDAVNDDPVNTVPAAQATNEDTDLVFSNGTGNPFAVADVDAGAGNITSTLTVTNGTLTVIAGGGVADNGTNSVTIIGTVAEVNAALATVTYTPTANFNGPATLTMTTNDGGNTGAGGGTDQVSMVAITVNAVNDDPVNTVPAAQATNEDTDLVFSNGTGNPLAVADVDAGAGNITTTLTVTNGTLTVVAGGGVTDNGTSSVTIIGTVAEVNAALATVTYTPTANFNGPATLTMTTNDGGNSGAGGGTDQVSMVAITVNAVNDDPVNTVPAVQATNEDTDLVFSNGTGNPLAVADVDAGAGNITSTLTVTNGTLTVVAGGGVTSNGTNSVTIIGTVAEVNAALATVTYTPTANFNGPATLTMTTNDGGNSGTGGGTDQVSMVAITVNAVNDDPVNTVPAAQATNEDTDLVFSNGTGNPLAVTDVDAGAGNITTTLTVTNGTLAVVAGGGVTNNGTNSVTIIGTVAEVNAALATVTYTPTANFNGPATLTMTTNDGGNSGTGGGTDQVSMVTITVNAVNDPPLVANLAGDTATVIAAGPAANVDVGGDTLVTDPDNATDFGGGFIVFDITAGTDNGSFSFDGVNVASGGDATISGNEIVTVGGVAIGTVSNIAGQDGQGGNLLRIDFNAGATPVAISTLVQNLLYAAPSGFGDRTLTTTIDDGDGTANGGDSDTIIVSTINVPVAPQVQSIVRQDPTAADTNADAVTFRVTFDSDVVNVDSADFALSGALAGVSTITGVNQISSSVYDVTVDVPDAGNGTINLDISATPTVQNAGGINLQNAAVPIGADETYTIDNISPAIPSIDLTAASDTNINNDDITSDTTPTFTGIAEAGSTITLSSSIDGQFVQGTAADYGGAGLTPLLADALSQGVHTITVTSTDAAGNASVAALTVTIDTTAPVLNAFTLNTPANAQTNADTLVFEAAFDEIVSGVDAADFSVNGATTATVTNVAQTSPTTFLVTVSGGDLANFDGSVNLNLAAAAAITDVAGNALVIAEPGTDETYILDNTAPNPPTGLDLQALSDTGVSNTDDLTADTTPTIAGTAEANATIILTSDRDGVVGVATANLAGVWTVTTNSLSEGVHSLTATATDATGNISAASAPLAITIDVTANAPSAPDLAATSDTGPSNTDNATSDTTPTLTGTAEAGSTVTLTSSISGAVGTALADAAGLWSVTTPTLPEGVHIFTAFMTDRAGNISPASMPTTVTISIGGGQASTGTDGSDIGGLGSSNDGVSGNRSDAASGNEAGIDGSGSSFDTGTPFGAGPQFAQGGAAPLAPGRAGVDDIITAGIGTGNPFPGTGISDSDLPGTIVLHPSSDTGFSNADNMTRDNTPTFTGEAPVNTVVTITSSLGGILGTANVDENGQWTFTSPSLADGIHELIATPKDENGKEGTPSLPLLVTIDTVAPPAPSAPEFVGDIDQLKSDEAPVFKGRAEPGARIVLTSDQDGIVGQAIVDENGNWQVTTDPLSENGHNLSVTATDPAGNTSNSSPVLELIVRAEDDTALNFDHPFPVQVDINRADGSITFDVAALLNGFSADIVQTEIHDRQDLAREPSNTLGFTRQLQLAGNNRSLQVYL